MAKNDFNLGDHAVEARLARLDRAQADALESLLQSLAEREPDQAANGPSLLSFSLSLIESGLSAAQALSLLGKIPRDFPLDHRRIYFDFRLARWMRHIEPPGFEEIMEEYLEHAPSPEAGLAYLRQAWAAFLRRHAQA